MRKPRIDLLDKKEKPKQKPWIYAYYALMLGTQKRAARIKNANQTNETGNEGELRK